MMKQQLCIIEFHLYNYNHKSRYFHSEVKIVACMSLIILQLLIFIQYQFMLLQLKIKFLTNYSMTLIAIFY